MKTAKVLIHLDMNTVAKTVTAAELAVYRGLHNKVEVLKDESKDVERTPEQEYDRLKTMFGKRFTDVCKSPKALPTGFEEPKPVEPVAEPEK